MTKLEQLILDDLTKTLEARDPNDFDTVPHDTAKAYHELMEGYRSRVDAEMMAYTFEQTKIQMQRQEQVVKAAAQGLGHAG